MGYDEHYVGSEEAGSVASLPWVEKGIQDTIAEVPAQRVINAVPFYTRLWKTEAGSLSSEAIGMDTAQEVVNTNNAQVYWDSDVSQNYGSFEKDGCTYQIWIEDSQSIAAKVQLIQKYNLAGVAAWKLGFENSSIWQVITDNPVSYTHLNSTCWALALACSTAYALVRNYICHCYILL